MTANMLISVLRDKGIKLMVEEGNLRVKAPKAVLAECQSLIVAHKAALVDALLAPQPSGCAWREDECGRLIFSDGTVYSPTATGGWILVKHPTRRVVVPGTLAIDGGQCDE